MNDMTTQSTDAPVFLIVRTSDVIAAEINGIKSQTRSMMMTASIEIGRRLTEAKSLLDHGEWGEWLESRVAYSKSTANNLMRIFDEFGARQITMLDDNASSATFQRLGYTQAVALLGLPADDREAFIAENPVDEMSTRELQQAIRERDQARMEKDKAEKAADDATMRMLKEMKRAETAEADAIGAEEENAEAIEAAQAKVVAAEAARARAEKEAKLAVDKAVSEARKELDGIKAERDEQAKLLKERQEQTAELKKQLIELQSKPMQVNPGATEEDIADIRTKLAEDYEQKLADADAAMRASAVKMKELQALAERKGNESAIKFRAHFETITSVFGLLLASLGEIKTSDEDMHRKHQGAVLQLLEKMRERL